MAATLKFSYISSFNFTFCLLVVATLFRLCLSAKPNDATLCLDDERQALLRFKHGLIDDADQLASWIGEKSDCCKWVGILCDNVTGHVHKIHLPGPSFSPEAYEEAPEKWLSGNISPSILNLKQLEHLDLSSNDFKGIQIPNFMGSLGKLRYLNLSFSEFGGTIPPQLGNLTELSVLCLGRFYDADSDEYESTSIVSMQWLSSLRLLRHLDMSGVDLTNATDWFQVINTLPSLSQLHFSNCRLHDIHPKVASVNLTFLSSLDLSNNNFNKNSMPPWIFSITSLVSLDLRSCGLQGHIPSSIYSFHNLTNLKVLRISGNEFMNSSLVLKGLSSIGGNLISLHMSSCGVSNPVLDSLHNFTSLLSLDLTDNELTSTIPKSLGNLCNLRHLYLGFNNFQSIRLTSLLEGFLDCKSPSLESLSFKSSGLSTFLPSQLGQLINLVDLELTNNRIAGPIPDSIGRLSNLRSLDLYGNLISGQIPDTIGRLSNLRSLYLGENLISGPIPYPVGELLSLKGLLLSDNQLTGTLPESLGQLSRLIVLDVSNNLLTGVVTDSHFSNLTGLKYLSGRGNKLTLRPRHANWIPSFQLEIVYLSSWNLGPQFPSWLLTQRELEELDMRNTRISATMSESFWSSFPNLQYLDMSQNQIQGRLLDIPATIEVVDLNSNLFSGILPKLYNGSLLYWLDLSDNSFTGSLHNLLCPYGGKQLNALNLADNHLSGVIPECWVKWPSLSYLNLENNNLSGRIPTTLGSLSYLGSLNMCKNKLSGELPASLKDLKTLQIFEFATNELVGSIPAWIGTELLNLRILNLRSNNFDGNITHELCYLTSIHILYLAQNNLSGNIPRCFSNFSVMSKKEAPSNRKFVFTSYGFEDIEGSASLVMKGHEYTYTTTLGLVLVLDLSSNNLSGSIPIELMALQGLQTLNLSRNQLTGVIPKNIGGLKSLESFDVSQNHLFGELPTSLSSLNFLGSFNVSFNNLTGRIPSSTQLQSFNESSFFGNKLCGDPLTDICELNQAPNQDQEEEEDELHGLDWSLIISTLSGFIGGFWLVLAPLIVNTTWRKAYFGFLNNTKWMFCDAIYKYRW